MMIDKRLIGLAADGKAYIAAAVALQWLALAANIALMASITTFLASLITGGAAPLGMTLAVALGALLLRFASTLAASRMHFLAAHAVKGRLRTLIYEKLLRLGSGYRAQVRTSEVIQVAVEGVDQLDAYFGAYLPQFFYALLAPLTLFAVLCTINVPVALVLLVCVPLIPLAIGAVQAFARRLLGQYWHQYANLGETFLENLQGLTTLKIYQADAYKNEEMNAEAEKFRQITMRVLTMQLNSITIMDLIAYGGAALGITIAAWQFAHGGVSLAGALLIMLLAADFFLPMRQLGSFFHIAMNGMAASEKIFCLLDLPEPTARQAPFPAAHTIRCRDLRFAYEPEREILHGIDLTLPAGSFTAIVGPSGCGKSTIASILMGRSPGFSGSVHIGDTALAAINEGERLRHITLVSHQSPLFKGTVRDNLLLAAPTADDAALWHVLEQVRLADFLRSQQGLETPLQEQAANLSGGQRQRLALARALLHDSPIYIFDEATSNIDIDSENDIMNEIHTLAKTKTVLLISHRLANVVNADEIYVMDAGRIVEHGSHAMLLARRGTYATLWQTQQALEQFGKEEASYG